MRLSVCILVKDEAKLLSQCIESVKNYVDEIIVVNNGSTDGSRSIAEKYGCQIIDFNSDDLDAGRNSYMSATKTKWILVLDSDERMTEDGMKKLNHHLDEQPDDIMGIRLPRYEYIGDGKWSAIDILRVCRNHPDIKYNPTKIHATFGPSIVKMGGKISRIYDTPIHHFDILIPGRTAKKRQYYINLLETEIDNNPEPYLISFLGVEYAALGQNEKAIRQYKRAIDLDRENLTKARLYLAQLYVAIDDLTSAEVEAKICLDSNKALSDRAYTLLAEIAFRKGKMQLAKEYCTNALNIEPLGAHYHINIGTLLIKDEPSFALKHFNKAISLNPYLLNPNIYRSGETPNIFLQQNSLLSSVNNIFKHLAECYLKIGNLEMSKKWSEKEKQMMQIIIQHDLTI